MLIFKPRSIILLVLFAVFILACLSSVILYQQGNNLVKNKYQIQLLTAASMASNSINVNELQDLLKHPEVNSLLPATISQPLKRMIVNEPAYRRIAIYFLHDNKLRYLQTNIRSKQAANPIAAEASLAPDTPTYAAILHSLRSGEPEFVEFPYAHLGNRQVISAYAPLRNDKSQNIAVMGIEMDAGKTLPILRDSGFNGLLLALWLAILAGVGVFLFQRRVEQEQLLLSQYQQELAQRDIRLAAEKTRAKRYSYLLHRQTNKVMREREEALASSRSLSRYINALGQEIRIQLHGIATLTRLLLDGQLSNTQRKLTHIVLDNSRVLANALGPSMDFAAIEAGQLTLQRSGFNLRQLVDELLNFYSDRAGQKNLRLSCHYPPLFHSHYRGDPVRLRQILSNLIDNAIKYTPAGEITLRVWTGEETADIAKVCFEVKDSGPGISPDITANINAGSATANDASSGLSICKSLVTSLGGLFSLRSQPAEGCTVFFHLPMQWETPTAKANLIVVPIKSELRGMRLLLVDNSSANRQIVTLLLTAWEVEYHIAENAEEILLMLRRASAEGKPYQLVLMDKSIVGMDAHTLTDIIKGEQELASVKIIAMSTGSNAETNSQWLRQGFAGYLAKPVRQQELYVCLISALVTRPDTQIRL